MEDFKKIRKIGKSSKYVTLPKEWGEINDTVKVNIINENKVEIVKVKIIDKI